MPFNHLLRSVALFSFVFCSTICTAQMPGPDDIRNAIAGEIASFKIAPQAVHTIKNTAVWNGTDSIRVRIYIPGKEKKYRIIFNIHGGALVAGDLDTHDNISRVLANRTNSIVVSLHYRRPPEFPFPAGLDDCEMVLNWIKKNAVSFGGDAQQLIVLGDSGGGLLATALEVKLNKSSGIRQLVLVNPAVDLRNPGQGLYGLVTQLYLGGKPATDSLASPILAKDFSYFPPTLIITCEKDELKPHGEALAGRIKHAATVVDIPKMDHLGGYWAAAHPDAQQAIDEVVKFLQKK